MISTDIERCINELTGVEGTGTLETVWIYGEIIWASYPAFKFIPELDRRQKRVTLMADQVTRYRDGETNLFLIEMPAKMAEVLDISDFILDGVALEGKKTAVDTSRPW